jgi:hypothetical protein
MPTVVPVESRVPNSPSPARPSRPAPLKEKTLASTYANYFRVTATAEETILDFGLMLQAPGVAENSVTLSDRIVLNDTTVRRLAQALNASLARRDATMPRQPTVSPIGETKA